MDAGSTGEPGAVLPVVSVDAVLELFEQPAATSAKTAMTARPPRDRRAMSPPPLFIRAGPAFRTRGVPGARGVTWCVVPAGVVPRPDAPDATLGDGRLSTVDGIRTS